MLGQCDYLTLAFVEMAANHIGTEMLGDILRDKDTEILVERNQMPVKCHIVGGRQAKPITRIHAGGFRLRPSENVAGFVHLGKVEPGNAAGISINVQNHGSKNALVYPCRPLPERFFSVQFHAFDECLWIGKFPVQLLSEILCVAGVLPESGHQLLVVCSLKKKNFEIP